MSPFRLAELHYRAAVAKFNALPGHLQQSDPDAFSREEDALTQAVRAVDSAPVEDWAEFADAFDIGCDGGASLPNDDLIMKLLDDTRRLISTGRA